MTVNIATNAEDFSERFPAAAAAIAGLDDENRQVVLLRLAADLNNGTKHFDHSDTPGAYSWLCLACARAGRGPYYVDARTMGLPLVEQVVEFHRPGDTNNDSPTARADR